MFEIRVETVFSAAHAITIAGQREPLHGHDWRITAVIGADNLDADGLVCDFHALERDLADITRPFRNANLNDTPPFDALNPTAEHVAMHIGRELAARLPDGARLISLSTTEAAGCVATWRPE